MIDIDKSLNFIDSFLKSSESISVIIKRIDRDQLHVGLAFKEKDVFNAIHLEWH